MNKILKYSAVLLAYVLSFSFGACTDEYEYSKANIEGEQVYFSNKLSSHIELSKSESSIKVPVNRINKEGSLVVDLNVTTADNNKVNVPTSVAFADGEDVAYLSVTYDPATIEYGHSEDITISIKDESYTTPYGGSSYTFSVGLSEWKLLGTSGYYREGILSSFYGTDVLTYQVEIQENINTPGIYRVVTPYGPGTDFYSTYITSAEPEFAWTGETNTSMIINATDPDNVYISGDFYPGTDDGMASRGYGKMHLFSVVEDEAKSLGSIEAVKQEEPELFGTLRDGIITFPQVGVYVNFDDSFEPLGYLNTSNLAVALPSYEFTDYTSSFEYTGRFIDLNDNYYMQGTITLGEDVTVAKYILAAEGDDVDAIIEALDNGSVEPLGTITANTDVKIPLTESGKYYMIVVTYDADGKMRGSSVTGFTFSVSSTQPDWQPLFTGTFIHNYQPAFITDNNNNYVGNPLISMLENNYSTVLYQDANDPTSFKIEPWIRDETSLPFTMGSEGNITFKDVETGFADRNNGPLYAGDAAVMFGASQVTSAYDPEEGMFIFGTVYYCEGPLWYGGAFEVFQITGQARAYGKNKQREFKPLFVKKAGSKAKRIKNMKATKKVNIKGKFVRK